MNETGYFGIVEDIKDPEKRGRIKVRVFVKYDNLELNFIPWSNPDFGFVGGDSSGGGNFALPKIGTIVFVYFLNDDFYHPIWKGIPVPSTSLIEFIGTDYENAVSLFYDKELECGSLMIPSRGILNFYKKASILIRKDSTIILKTEKQTLHINNGISLGSEDKSNEPSVLGNKNVDVLEDIVGLLSELVNLLKNYGTKQSVSAGANFITSSLVPNLTALLTSSLLLEPKIEILKTKIPKTKSKNVTLN
jgi:hypothetical protein